MQVETTAIGWLCRPGSSTSAETRPPATSALPKRCWQTYRPCMLSTTAHRLNKNALSEAGANGSARQGLEETARRVHTSTLLLSKGLADSGNDVETGLFFDTIKVQPRLDQAEIRHRAKEIKINLRYFDDGQVSRPAQDL